LAQQCSHLQTFAPAVLIFLTPFCYLPFVEKRISVLTLLLCLNYEFDLLAMTAKPSFLYYFYQDGRPEAVKNFKSIGSGKDHGLLYLNRYYSENKTMDEIADLGYFIIRYIEKFELDSGVGMGKERPNPLISFIPNSKKDTKPSRQDYTRYEKNARIRLQKIEKSLLTDYIV
jgi:hypothetical protein